jgi:hypothetical protein
MKGLCRIACPWSTYSCSCAEAPPRNRHSPVFSRACRTRHRASITTGYRPMSSASDSGRRIPHGNPSLQRERQAAHRQCRRCAGTGRARTGRGRLRVIERLQAQAADGETEIEFLVQVHGLPRRVQQHRAIRRGAGRPRNDLQCHAALPGKAAHHRPGCDGRRSGRHRHPVEGPRNFRSAFGLSAYSGTFSQIHPGPGCGDPGKNGAEGEAALDAEWAGAVAPDATVHLASCADTTTNFGAFIAAQNLLSMKPHRPPS